MVPRLPAEGSSSPRCRESTAAGAVHEGDELSYTPRIQMRFRIAEPGEITNGRLLQVGDVQGGRVDVLAERGHCKGRLIGQVNRIWTHMIVDGMWRQRWTHDGRMERPAQGLGLFTARWERVRPDRIPGGRAVYGVEHEGSAVWLVDEDECSKELQGDVNDLFLRLAGDGLWIQVWLRNGPPPIPVQRRPLLAPASPPLIMA